MECRFWSFPCPVPSGVIREASQEFLEDALEGLRRALRAGMAVLEGGGSALDAVEAAVIELEEDPHFNVSGSSRRGGGLAWEWPRDLHARGMVKEGDKSGREPLCVPSVKTPPTPVAGAHPRAWAWGKA